MLACYNKYCIFYIYIYIYINEIGSSYTQCNSTKMTHFLSHRFMRDSTNKNKISLSITTLNTYLINSLLIISLFIKYFLCLFFSFLIKSFFPFSLQFLLRFYFLSFFLPEYHFPYTCFTKCSRKNIHGRSCKILLSWWSCNHLSLRHGTW